MKVQHAHPVPHLTTAVSGPLQEIEGRLLRHQTTIEQWFRNHWLNTPAPLYASVDLRNAGFKLAPVDTNLFPAGFNNLNPAFRPLCVSAIQYAAERLCPKACKVLLVPENHSRNTFYYESLAELAEILRLAGFEARIGSLRPDLEAPETLTLPSGAQLTLERPLREGARIRLADGFTPCFVLLNNDLSGGRPPILEDLEQPVVPPLALGWSERLKSDHFSHYDTVAREFAALIDIDSWLINPMFRKCGQIDFHKREGEDCVVRYVETLIEQIGEKYAHHHIDHEPFVIIKANAGTYGMNVVTVRRGEDVRALNRKQRSKMRRGKEGAAVSQVIIQEGIYTFEHWGEQQAVAEPVVYMIDHFVVGGFYRVHTGRGAQDNLNAPGMQFEPLAFDDCCTAPDRRRAPDAHPNRFYAYGVVARLALLAAARELQAA